MLDRYVSRHGPLLANGLAYGLLFAFFAGVWIAVSVFGLIMVGNIDWQQMLIDAVREVIPGVADSFLTSSALNTMSSTLTWTGLATLAMFWWTVTGWMNSLRHAVRSMFDDCGDELNIVVARLRDTLAAIAIAILFILSTAAGTVSGGMVRRVLQWSGIASSSLPGILLLELTGFCTGVALNFALFMLLLRVVAHIKAGRFTLIGASSGSLTVSVMQLLGARLLTGASRNPLLAPFAALIGALVWFNLVAQVIMLCAALIAECRREC
ncbi:ribonuclease BN [Bifidobacterium longum]|nr:ribonuclease BN [Bifidobacterium longum]MBK5041592.1 YihY/virulence factor BrkB family protein [Bifidobacterium longum subsp. longum]